MQMREQLKERAAHTELQYVIASAKYIIASLRHRVPVNRG
jgi:hypothetical protein